MIVEQAEEILHITVVTDVQTGDALIVRLIILVDRPHRFTEEISRTPRQTEVAARTPRQLLLQIDRLIPIHRRDDTGHGIRRTVHIVIVHAVEVGRKHIGPVLQNVQYLKICIPPNPHL